MEPTIKLEKVKKSFNGHSVLDGIELSVKKNEVLSIIGPSGAGKSTLVRIIAGLEKPNHGHAIVDGTAGVVFQHCHLWPHKTVLENVVEALVKVKKVDRKTAITKAIEALDKLGLSHKVNAFPDTLSGGEMRRVAIARTLVMEPAILLLDEITAGLDPLLVREVLETLRKLAREKRTLVIVTHEMEFAKEISDRVVFLDGGKVVEEGHPYKIFTNPENDRTRNFINAIKTR